jgi:hypothetical protein
MSIFERAALVRANPSGINTLSEAADYAKKFGDPVNSGQEHFMKHGLTLRDYTHTYRLQGRERV